MLTKKQVFAMNKPVFAIAYCDLQGLLPYTAKIGYNAGIYGHNYDVYVFDNAVITTGYRPIGKYIPHVTCSCYENMAAQIRRRPVPYEETQKALQALLHNFLESLELY